MKRIIITGILLSSVLLMISCSQTSESQQAEELISQNVVEAVEEVKIEDVGIEEEMQEIEIPEPEAVTEEKKTAEPKKEALPKAKSETTVAEEPAKPIKSKPTEILKEEVNAIANDEVKPKGSKRQKIASLPTIKAKEKTAVKEDATPSHSAWNGLLKAFVATSGNVNYRGLKAKESTLDGYLKELADNPVKSSWSKNEKMAYWINLYNASTVKLILDNYPISSIQNIANGKPWDKRWIKSGNKTYTLNEIENSILRPQFNDARIHFAVNCAAQSCPRLMNQAFTASNLNTLLDQNAKWFVNNSSFNKISSKKVEISKIFKWYAADFGNIIDFLNQYSTVTINTKAKVEYLEYDWKLNGK